MLKKRNRFIYPGALFQIFLLILSSVAIASFLGESFVSADPVPNLPSGLSTFTNAPQGSVFAAEGKYYLMGKDGWALAPKGTPIPGGGVVGEGGVVGGTGGGAAGGDIVSSVFGGQAFGAGIAGALFSGLVWGAIVGGAAYFLAGMFGLNEQQAASVGLGLGAGTFVGTSLYFVGQNTLPAAELASPTLSNFAFTPFGGLLIGAGVAAAVIILTYKNQKKELVRFECLPWEPPTGGSKCEECNNNPLMPCSEYRCKSLGQACEIVNSGTTDEKCVWVSKGDTAAPHFEPWVEALSPNGLRYTPDPTISPPNRGFKIEDSAGKDACLPAFTRVEFGIKADEPAQCRIDYEPRTKYSEMQFLLGESNLFLEEHTQRIKPINVDEENGSYVPDIGVGGTFTYWVRCIDANGNGEDSAAVAFKICVDKGPDETPPAVEGTSIATGLPVQFNVDSVPIEVYTNEPAECRWSMQDKAFEAMENPMDCSTETYQINANLDYVCSSDLTGIKNREENWFYFRCKDRKGNIMPASYPLLLQGTEELTISNVGPTGAFTGSTSVIPVALTVETAHGAENGNSICSYSTSESDSASFVAMERDATYKHNETLYLTGGNYTYYFRCIDGGGNLAKASTNFEVSVDTTAPKVTRVFKDGNSLKVITNEDSKCYYSNTNCNYDLEGGIAMSNEDPKKQNIHTAEWKEAVTYYVRCADLQGNQPSPDTCQIIVRASEL